MRRAKPHLGIRSRSSLVRVNLFFDLRHCSTNVPADRRCTVIHDCLNKISDQWRMQIGVG